MYVRTDGHTDGRTDINILIHAHTCVKTYIHIVIRDKHP